MESAGEDFSKSASSAFAGAKGLGQGAVDALPSLPEMSFPEMPSMPDVPSMPDMDLPTVPGFDALGSAGSSMFDGATKAGRFVKRLRALSPCMKE
jgi:hypothetical protein